MSVLRMTDLDLRGKRVLIREDLNVPVKEGRITSEQRIKAALPTLRLALEKGAAEIGGGHRAWFSFRGGDADSVAARWQGLRKAVQA